MTPELIIALSILSLWPICGVIMHLFCYVWRQGFEWTNKHEYKALFLSALLGPKVYWIWKAERERAEFLCELIMEIINRKEQEEQEDESDSDS